MPKQSFKSKIQNLINDRGEVSINEIYRLCEQQGHKYETAARELRKLSSKKNQIPSIAPVEKNGAIIGYRWVDYRPSFYTAQEFMREWGTKPKVEVTNVLF